MSLKYYKNNSKQIRDTKKENTPKKTQNKCGQMTKDGVGNCILVQSRQLFPYHVCRWPCTLSII